MATKVPYQTQIVFAGLWCSALRSFLLTA